MKTLNRRATARSHSYAHRVRPALSALAAALALHWAASAHGAPLDTWTLAGSGLWNTAANWTNGSSGHTVPATNDNVSIVSSDLTTRTVTYDYTGAAVSLLSLNIDQTGAATTNTLSMAANALTTTGDEVIGINGRGAFTQTGGTNTVGSTLILAQVAGSTGTYNLGGTGSLTASNAYIGGSSSASGGAGALNISGGTMTVGTLKCWNTAGSAITVNGGTLTFTTLDLNGNTSHLNFASGTLNSTSNLIIDSSGPLGDFLPLSVNKTFTAPAEAIGTTTLGTVTQTGGTHTIATYMDIATAAGGSGSIYTLSGGTLAALGTGVNASHWGDSGNANFIQTGGSATMGDVEIARTISISTAVTLNDPTASATFTANAFYAGGTSAGSGGTAIVNITGGTMTLASLKIWNVPSQVNLNGGTLNVGTIDVNNNSNSFVWSSGTLHITGSTTAAVDSADLNLLCFGGTLNLDTSHTLSMAGQLTVGNHNSGTVNQTTNASVGYLALGNFATATGTFNLSNATLTCAGTELIGVNGNGSFTQTGGTNNTGYIIIAYYPGETGYFALSNGTCNVAGAVTVGGDFSLPGGTGTLYISGGAMSVNGALKIHNSTGTSVSLSGGSLSVESLDTSGNPSRFSWYAGNFTVTGYAGLTIDAATGPLASLYVNTGMILTTTYGLTNNASLYLSGGIISGPLTNNAYFTASGTLTGAGGFVNNAIANVLGDLTVSNSGASSNTGNFSLSSGYHLFLNGGNFTNSGTLNLNGGIVAGSATLINAPDGTISGAGTISAPFTNAGLITLDSGSLKLPTFINNGTILLNGPAASIAGAIFITNNATVQGNGKINASIVNNATIEASGGTLILAGAVTNGPVGSLNATTGNKILAYALGSNDGLINLTGGTFDNNNQTLTNNGQIAGYGTLRTGGLTNNGTIYLTGGTSTINGDVTNLAFKSIYIQYQPAIFTGTVVNNPGAIMKVINTTVTFTGAFYNYGTYPSDPATNIFQNEVFIGAAGSMTGGLGDVFNFSGPSVTNQGTFNNGGSLTSSSPFINTGTFTQSGPQSWSNGTTFTNSGNATFASDAGSPSAKNLHILQSAGTLTLSVPQHLAALTLSGGTLALSLATPADSTKIVTDTLTLNGGSLRFSAPNTKASVGYYKIIQAGTLQGAGLGSISIAADTNPNITCFFDTTHDLGFIDVHRGFIGDADDSGTVDLTDLTLLAGHWQQTGASWSTGDFNHDGHVDLTDLTLLAGHWQSSLPLSEALVDTGLFTPNSGLPTPTPEPASLLLLTPTLLLLRRRQGPIS